MSVVETTSEWSKADEFLNLKTQRRRAWDDVEDGLKMWPVWLKLAWQDIYLRYRRSLLGPLWITLSMAIMVYSMGFLYAHLWHVELKHYFPYLVAGMVVWTFISMLIIEATEAYLSSGNLIRQIKLPYTLHIHRLCTRNFMIFMHNILVMLPVYFIFYRHIEFNFSILVFLCNLFILYINAFLFSNVIAICCARYRDLGQVFKSLVQVFFFMTPVLWDIHVLPEKYQFIAYNPFYNYIELIRQPLLGAYPSVQNYVVTGLCALLGGLMNIYLFVRYRSRIVYWL